MCLVLNSSLWAVWATSMDMSWQHHFRSLNTTRFKDCAKFKGGRPPFEPYMVIGETPQASWGLGHNNLRNTTRLRASPEHGWPILKPRGV